MDKILRNNKKLMNDVAFSYLLEELTFNYVVKEIKETIQKLQEENLIIIDAPLLFEAELDKICDLVIGVIAKEQEKIERICNRDNINKETAKKRLNIQKSNEYIKEKSDYIIYNESSIEKLEEEIDKLNLEQAK